MVSLIHQFSQINKPYMFSSDGKSYHLSKLVAASSSQILYNVIEPERLALTEQLASLTPEEVTYSMLLKYLSVVLIETPCHFTN